MARPPGARPGSESLICWDALAHVYATLPFAATARGCAGMPSSPASWLRSELTGNATSWAPPSHGSRATAVRRATCLSESSRGPDAGGEAGGRGPPRQRLEARALSVNLGRSFTAGGTLGRSLTLHVACISGLLRESKELKHPCKCSNSCQGTNRANGPLSSCHLREKEPLLGGHALRRGEEQQAVLPPLPSLPCG